MRSLHALNWLMSHRVIVKLKQPLNRAICEDLTLYFGVANVVPLTENYCVIESYKTSFLPANFESLLQFIQRNKIRAILAKVDGDFDYQFQQLKKCPMNALLCCFEPPNIILYSTVQVNKQLWCIMPWGKPVFDDYE